MAGGNQPQFTAKCPAGWAAGTAKMSRLQVALVLAVFVLAHVKADEASDKEQAKEQAKQMIRSMAQTCKEAEGASDGDVDAMIDDVMPESQVQKCFHSCVQQQFGVSDGQKFLKHGFLEIMMLAVGDDEQQQGHAKEVAEECDGVANEDRCQLAVDIMTCVKQGMEKRAMKVDR